MEHVFNDVKVSAAGSFTTEEFSFESSGLILNGIISYPKDQETKSLLIIVHSYGATDVVKGNWFYGQRKFFTEHGIAVAVWDKPGCGNSEGDFNIQQHVGSSAQEVIDAVNFFRKNQFKGHKQIGLKGGSRAGWIAPLAINKLSDISFWISISGTDAYETWGYLLRSTLEVTGHKEAEVSALHNEWVKSLQVIMSQGSYSDYLSATKNLRKNKTYQELTGQKFIQHKEGSANYYRDQMLFEKIQKEHLAEDYQYDKESGLKIYVQDFEKILTKIDIPVLAIFGDNDRHVDWRKTKILYEQTMGNKEDTLLTVKVFPGADHALKMSETGSYFEVSKPGYWELPYAKGYVNSMIEFLCSNNFCSKDTSN
jgi:alpha-beta hydrolase superfamily lysophospholipase